MTSIREATEADGLAVVRLVANFIDGTPYSKLLTYHPDTLADLVAGLMAAGGTIFLAEVDGKAVGMLAIGPVAHPVSREIMASELAWWVEPAYRSGSIGPKLLRCAEDWTRQRGLSVLQMVAPAGSDVGNYYTRRGYTPIETVYQKRL